MTAKPEQQKKNKQEGLYQSKNILYTKGSNQNKKATYGMGENILKFYT